MTTFGTPLKKRDLVPTGDWVSPTRISVEAIGKTDPVALVGTIDQATFSSSSGNIVSVNCFCESASVEGRVGDVFRCRFVFTETHSAG